MTRRSYCMFRGRGREVLKMSGSGCTYMRTLRSRQMVTRDSPSMSRMLTDDQDPSRHPVGTRLGRAVT